MKGEKWVIFRQREGEKGLIDREREREGNEVRERGDSQRGRDEGSE